MASAAIWLMLAPGEPICQNTSWVAESPMPMRMPSPAKEPAIRAQTGRLWPSRRIRASTAGTSMIVLSRMNSEKMYQRPGWALIAAICARSPLRSGGQAQAATSPSSGGRAAGGAGCRR